MRLAGHVVELSGERLDSSPVLMAMRRPRSPRCAAPASNVWIGTHHAPGEEHARREGERERAEKDEPGALERSIERRIDSSTGVSTNTSQPSGAQSMVVVLSADYPIA
jgi:hypothetical protein